jgi:hypothetical protein
VNLFLAILPNVLLITTPKYSGECNIRRKIVKSFGLPGRLWKVDEQFQSKDMDTPRQAG